VAGAGGRAKDEHTHNESAQIQIFVCFINIDILKICTIYTIDSILYTTEIWFRIGFILSLLVVVYIGIGFFLFGLVWFGLWLLCAP